MTEALSNLWAAVRMPQTLPGSSWGVLPASLSKATVHEMRRWNLLREQLPLILVAITVPFIFRLVPDRRIAATMAGSLFVFVPLILMLWRWKRAEPEAAFSKRLWWLSVLQFWILFALPILGMRLLFWETPFDDIRFFGVPGPLWHSWSTRSYLVMLAGTLVANLFNQRK